ncbi:MAG TPA: hypothetical protein VF944_05380 [Candidatus Bathyarchaeia archaeon]
MVTLYYDVENWPELIGDEGLGPSKYPSDKNILSPLDLTGNVGD